MKAGSLVILLCTVAAESVSAAPLDLAQGLWEVTARLRNFSISADARREVESGKSEPFIERICITEEALKSSSLDTGENSTAVKDCKTTAISETPRLVNSVVECFYEGGPSSIEHSVVTAPTPKSFTTIREKTFLEPNFDGSISRSTIYMRGEWLKESCDNASGR